MLANPQGPLDHVRASLQRDSADAIKQSLRWQSIILDVFNCTGTKDEEPSGSPALYLGSNPV